MRNVIALGAAVMVAGVVSVGAAAPIGAASATDDKFCDANFAISIGFNDQPDGDAPAKVQKAFYKKMNALLLAAEKIAPDEIASDVSTVVTAIVADPETAFEDPAVGAGVEAIDAWAVANCDYNLMDVTAVDYSFEGVPETMPTGKAAFTLTNDGTELHEMVVFRVKTDTPIADLLELPDKKVEKQVEFMGAAFALPGETFTGYAEFKKPGRYVAICFIPEGTTSETSESDGPPHFTHGMVAEFEVEKG